MVVNLQEWTQLKADVQNVLGKYLDMAETIIDTGQDVISNGKNVLDKVNSIPALPKNALKDKQIRHDYKNELNSVGEDIINSFNIVVEGLDSIKNYFPLNSSVPKSGKDNSSKPKNNAKVYPIKSSSTDKNEDKSKNNNSSTYKTKNQTKHDSQVKPTFPQTNNVVSEENKQEKSSLLFSIHQRYGMSPRKRQLRKNNKPGNISIKNNLLNNGFYRTKKPVSNNAYSSIDETIKNEVNDSSKIKKTYSTIDKKVGNNSYSSKTTSKDNSILKRLTTSYKANIAYVVNNYSGVAKDVAEIVSGKSEYNTNGVKKTAWKWSERFKILNDYLDNKLVTGKDDEGLEAMLGTLNSNKYMKRKYSDEFITLKNKIKKTKGNYVVKSKRFF